MSTTSTYPQGDTLVGPIVEQLAVVAGQVEGVGRLYTKAPDGPPEDNSVIFPLRQYKVLAESNGKLKIALEFEVMHLFRRTRLGDALDRAQQAFVPWLQALAAWSNQRLGGLAMMVNLSDGKLYDTQWAGTPYIALSHTVTVVTLFNIPVS